MVVTTLLVTSYPGQWPGYETKVVGDLHKILCFTVITANITGEPSTLASYPGH